MRILLLGKNGQLGWELARCLPTLGTVTVLDYPEIDLTNAVMTRQVVRGAAPDVIINATAYTAVDKAETEHDVAWAVNATAPGLLAEEASAIGAALIHFSTDYVFDGAGRGELYTETDATNPLNEYGRSKLAGEQAIQAVDGQHLILRTAWVYSLRGDSFVNKVLGWARKNQALRIVADQVSNPTWARMLAEVTAQVLARGPAVFREHSGLYHLAGSGYASRLEWAREILALDPHKEQQVTTELAPGTTAEFPTPAQRPLYSALDCSKFEQHFGLCLPDWKTALRLAMAIS